MVTPIRTAPSRRKAARPTAMGAITALTPRINRIFAILEPTTLPAATAGAPFRVEESEVVSSGVEVPNPTITRPIRSGETLRLRASPDAPRTSASPPKNSTSRPDKTKNTLMEMLVRCCGADPRTAL